MKHYLRPLLLLTLRALSRRILKIYKPFVIGVTGSVGKTSAKEAIFDVVNTKYTVRRSVKNYNTESGVPLTIIDYDQNGPFTIFSWFKVFAKALKMIIFKKEQYPEILVIEMGVDKKGDMDYLLSIVKPDLSVITAITTAHLERFSSFNDIIKEKVAIAKYLNPKQTVVINGDDPTIASNIKTKGNIVTYGFGQNVDFKGSALEIVQSDKDHIDGIRFKLHHKGTTVPVQLPRILGKQQVASALAAATIGVLSGMNQVEVGHALGSFQSPPGRMRLLDGIKHTYIIDDTYNSHPVSAVAAVETLGDIETTNTKFAVMGDMLELGKETIPAHHQVAESIVKNEIDYLITSGPLAMEIAIKAKALGMPEDRIFSFDKAEEAGKFIQDRIKRGDVILVKGSQGARMEKVVKELMADPIRAKDLLVRQETYWKA